jgi:peptidylprolyl isomerase
MAAVEGATMKGYLVPAVAAVAVVVLAGLVIYVSAGERKMSDGSNGSADDPDLKEAEPGVKYRDIKVGLGEPCPPGAKVTIHYTGWLPNGDVFDSTKEGKANPQPAEFQLRGLIKGWQEGIPGMARGGIRKLVISSEKGYGERGSPPKIPPNSTLIFEVELLDFVAPKNVASGPGQPMPFDKSNGGTEDPGLKDLGDGLKYRDLKEGTGEPVKAGGEVSMHYTGWLVDGTQFDSSRTRGRPLDAILKPGTERSVIEGWNRGVVGMKPGGVRKLVIPAAMAYGERGQGEIPGGATLIFEVELVR